MFKISMHVGMYDVYSDIVLCLLYSVYQTVSRERCMYHSSLYNSVASFSNTDSQLATSLATMAYCPFQHKDSLTECRLSKNITVT